MFDPSEVLASCPDLTPATRTTLGLPALGEGVEWSRAGTYRRAVTELRADHAAALLRDLRKTARVLAVRQHGALRSDGR